MFGRFEIAKLIIQDGENLNTADLNKFTALHRALQYEQPEIAELIIESLIKDSNNSDLELWEDGDYMTPLHLAAKHGYIKAFQMMIQHAKEKNPKDTDTGKRGSV